MTSFNFEIAVVGSGHAGCEAALSCARLGVRTALITTSSDVIARMSCNPSIGGMAKSHIVVDIDNLGGEIARNTDYTGIQFRTLNTRKGPSVQATRAQCDKAAFSARMKDVVLGQPGLTLVCELVSELIVTGSAVTGVKCQSGRSIRANAVIIACGTFLNGRIFIGKTCFPGGRAGEPAAESVSDSIKRLGIEHGRLKTGTPPRIHSSSVDFSVMKEQPGEYPPPFFSRDAMNDWNLFHVEHESNSGRSGQGLFHVEQKTTAIRPWPPGSDQLSCYITHTTSKTRSIISDHINESSLYGGLISGTGVRYCPSIEDKIVKFPDHETHHVFIEPEGRNSTEIYPNGTSNSLPERIQIEMIRSIPGLEKAVFTRPGYAIEYDFFQPTQLHATLESKHFESLYFAGQVNGTTGYEEAAGQGFIAGVNAALKIMGRQPFILDRKDSYIGVMIDDLITKGTDEPYRMFTSRAEHRLQLRQDNSAFRLCEQAADLGLVDAARIEETRKAIRLIEQEIIRLKTTFAEGTSLAQILRRPEMSYERLPGRVDGLTEELRRQVEIQVKYEGYIEREMRVIARSARNDSARIPENFDYDTIRPLRFEAREKLKKIRPDTLGQASRISGVNPSDISILEVFIKKTAKL